MLELKTDNIYIKFDEDASQHGKLVVHCSSEGEQETLQFETFEDVIGFISRECLDYFLDLE
jgi:hypothetical protein